MTVPNDQIFSPADLSLTVRGATVMNRGEFLQRLHPPKPQHRALSSSERQVRILSPIV